MLIDSHCHLDFYEKDELPIIINNILTTKDITIGVSIPINAILLES